MTALEQAYASNDSTPLNTLEFSHSSIDTIYLVQGFYDIPANLETGPLVTFQKSGIGIQLPERSTDGQQELQIQLDDVSNTVYQSLRAVQLSMRDSDEKAIIKYRPYLEADLSAPAGAVLSLVMTGASIRRGTATIRATWSPFPDLSFPRYRYYATKYPGVRYA